MSEDISQIFCKKKEWNRKHKDSKFASISRGGIKGIKYMIFMKIFWNYTQATQKAIPATHDCSIFIRYHQSFVICDREIYHKTHFIEKFMFSHSLIIKNQLQNLWNLWRFQKQGITNLVLDKEDLPSHKLCFLFIKTEKS